MAGRILRPVLGERRADVGEYAIYSTGYIVNAGDADQCDQGDQQCILNQILSILAVPQALDFHVQIHKHIAHCVVLPIGDNPASAGNFVSTISCVFLKYAIFAFL